MQFLKRQFNLLRENVIQYKYRKEMNPTRNFISFSNVREEMRRMSDKSSGLGRRGRSQ